MTLEQKIAQLHGAMETIDIYGLSREAAELEGGLSEAADQFNVERHVDALEELGIPRYRITNGPVGLGMGDGTPSPKATSLPMTIGLAAGFSPELAHDYGDIIGSESATKGQHVLEGPGVCLHRTPIAGRNFEYFSEDPYLSGVLGVAVTRAIQAHGVLAMGKHFVLNDQEVERFRTNVEVAEQVLRELYLLPFEMLVKDGDVAAIMGAYNRVRGTYASENRYLLNDVLRREWGFKGYVQSDFWSTRSGAPALAAGLDHEMPDAKWFNEETITDALNDTSLEIETVDRALRRRFTQMFRFGVFESVYAPGEIDAQAHGARARRIGAEVSVLLKNDAGRLPLPAETAEILVIGMSEFAEQACLGGGGSSRVDPLYTVDPVTGLRDVAKQAEVSLFTVDRDLGNLAAAAEAAADTVVIMAGLIATEGEDQAHPVMPHDQDTMIARLLEAAPGAIVVLKNSNPVLMPWIDAADTVLETWNQGSEDGHVVADLLFGLANPGGKLPTTYAAREEDLLYAGRPERYPGVDEGEGYPTIRYTEGLEMGYRWFQAQDITPLFPFGFGLSYTSFELLDPAVDAPEGVHGPVRVGVTVRNTGDRPGAEVVQVYAGIPAVGQPPKRLVGFRRVTLGAGTEQRVEILIDPAATHHPFGVWDIARHDFVPVDGEYTLQVGTSSADTPHVFHLR